MRKVVGAVESCALLSQGSLEPCGGRRHTFPFQPAGLADFPAVCALRDFVHSTHGSGRQSRCGWSGNTPLLSVSHVRSTLFPLSTLENCQSAGYACEIRDQMHFGVVKVTFPLHDLDLLCVTLQLPCNVKALPF